MSEIILKAEGVAMHFGGVKALDGIDFQLRKGELRCLIGPNGAGKTTFFRCLTGTQKPTQIPSLFDGLSVHENLWLSLRTVPDLRERERRIDEVLARVGVSDLRQGILGRMAHGQRQLVELAMVVASDPKLVLLDEPAAGMTALRTRCITTSVPCAHRNGMRPPPNACQDARARVTRVR